MHSKIITSIAFLTVLTLQPPIPAPPPTTVDQQVREPVKLVSELDFSPFEAEKPLFAIPVKKKKVPVSINSTYSGSRQDWLRAARIPEKDWRYVDYIISRESGWNYRAWNHAGSGAYGLCQSLPASKMASAGADYMTNPVTQLRWCDSYALARYGGWYNAYLFWVNNRWW